MEALSDEEEVDLRAKIDALKLEVTKVPSQSLQHTDDTEVQCFSYDSFLHFGFKVLDSYHILLALLS